MPFLRFYSQILLHVTMVPCFLIFSYMLIRWNLFAQSFSIARVVLALTVSGLAMVYSRPRRHQIHSWPIPCRSRSRT